MLNLAEQEQHPTCTRDPTPPFVPLTDKGLPLTEEGVTTKLTGLPALPGGTMPHTGFRRNVHSIQKRILDSNFAAFMRAKPTTNHTPFSPLVRPSALTFLRLQIATTHRCYDGLWATTTVDRTHIVIVNHRRFTTAVWLSSKNVTAAD